MLWISNTGLISDSYSFMSCILRSLSWMHGYGLSTQWLSWWMLGLYVCCVAYDLLEEKQSMDMCHIIPKNVGGSKCHIESLFRCVWWSWQDRTNLSFWGIMIPGVIQSFMLGFFFHVKSNPQNILLFFLLFTFIVIDVGFGQIQHSKNLCVYQIL